MINYHNIQLGDKIHFRLENNNFMGHGDIVKIHGHGRAKKWYEVNFRLANNANIILAQDEIVVHIPKTVDKKKI